MRLQLSSKLTQSSMNKNADRCGSESPVRTSVSPPPAAALFNPKRASMGSLLSPAFHRHSSLRSLPSSVEPRSHALLRQMVSNTPQQKQQGSSSQRRASLGLWLLKKFQHNWGTTESTIEQIIQYHIVEFILAYDSPLDYGHIDYLLNTIYYWGHECNAKECSTRFGDRCSVLLWVIELAKGTATKSPCNITIRNQVDNSFRH